MNLGTGIGTILWDAPVMGNWWKIDLATNDFNFVMFECQKVIKNITKSSYILPLMVTGSILLFVEGNLWYETYSSSLPVVTDKGFPFMFHIGMQCMQHPGG